MANTDGAHVLIMSPYFQSMLGPGEQRGENKLSELRHRKHQTFSQALRISHKPICGFIITVAPNYPAHDDRPVRGGPGGSVHF